MLLTTLFVIVDNEKDKNVFLFLTFLSYYVHQFVELRAHQTEKPKNLSYVLIKNNHEYHEC